MRETKGAFEMKCASSGSWAEAGGIVSFEVHFWLLCGFVKIKLKKPNSSVFVK